MNCAPTISRRGVIHRALLVGFYLIRASDLTGKSNNIPIMDLNNYLLLGA